MSSSERPIFRKISRGYQITLPPAFRERYHLSIGDHVELTEKNGLLVISPMADRGKKIAKQLANLFSEDPETELSDEDAMRLAIQEIKAARAERSGKSVTGDE